jgi:hypothetical protein
MVLVFAGTVRASNSQVGVQNAPPTGVQPKQKPLGGEKDLQNSQSNRVAIIGK